MKLFELLHIINYKSVYNLNDINIEGIAYNSNECKSNFLFVAINGEKNDGRNFINNAIQNGASVIVCNEIEPERYINNISYIIVDDTRLALASLSYHFYGQPNDNFKIIGITGTNGKTTTAFIVKSILENANKKVAMIGTTGIYIANEKIESTHTTPESLDLMKLFKMMLKKNIEFVIMEVSSHSLVQHRVIMIDFVIAAFTNITHDHLDYHKTFENYIVAKQILFQGLKPNTTAIINTDDPNSQSISATTNAKIIKISNYDKNADYFFDNIIIDKEHSEFQIHYNNNTIPINIQLTGYFNIQNATLAFAICNELNCIDIETIVNCISNSGGAPGRLQSVLTRTGATAYVDYAHTPDALEKVLITCKKLLESANNHYERHEIVPKLICVFGCGGDRDKIKRPEMGKIAQKYSDVVIITDDNPRTEKSKDIINNILSGIKQNDSIFVIADRSKAISYAVELSNKNDIILIAGKGHENYQIIGTTKIYFNDIEELKNKSYLKSIRCY